jgi:hypothetical protein
MGHQGCLGSGGHVHTPVHHATHGHGQLRRAGALQVTSQHVNTHIEVHSVAPEKEPMWRRQAMCGVRTICGTRTNTTTTTTTTATATSTASNNNNSSSNSSNNNSSKNNSNNNNNKHGRRKAEGGSHLQQRQQGRHPVGRKKRGHATRVAHHDIVDARYGGAAGGRQGLPCS